MKTQRISPKLDSVLRTLQALEEEIESHGKALEYLVKEYGDILEPKIKEKIEAFAKRALNMNREYPKISKVVYQQWSKAWESEGRPSY